MADVNEKFIANPSFGIQSVGKQTITVAWRPRYVIDTEADEKADPSVAEVGHYDGFCDWPILGGLGYMAADDRFSPLAVSLQPEIDLKGTMKSGEEEKRGYYKVPLPGSFFFGLFLSENPIHCSKLNVRASDVAALPSTLEILTPNSFSGQFDRQIVNILADTNMYQNQNTIVTLDCDFFIARNSILRVDSSFNNATAYSLYFDMTFDKYMSLEKAMVENYTLLQTSAGLQNAIESEIANINAKMPDLNTTQFVAQPVVKSPVILNSQPIRVWRPTLGNKASGSVQPSAGREGSNVM